MCNSNSEHKPTIELSIKMGGKPPCPEFDQVLKKVNVIIGANGEGKTTLLQYIAARTDLLKTSNTKRFCLIRGDRIAFVSNRSDLNRNEIENYDEELAGIFAHVSVNEKKLKKVFDSVLEMLCLDHVQKVYKHSEQCLRFTSQREKVPVREKSKIDKFKQIYEQIFPKIKLKFNPVHVSIHCLKNGNKYNPSQLSSGERQIFLLLGRLILDEKPEFFLIDEPESNLNPHLAEIFWSTVEAHHHPESIFLYATHSTSFTIRSGVDQIFLLNGNKTLLIDSTEHFHQLPKNIRKDFLGAVPSVVTHDKVLAIEGSDDGHDLAFFNFMFGDYKGLKIQPLGNSEAVLKLFFGFLEYIDQANLGILIKGIIDRDFRTDDQIAKLQERGISFLPYHELESVYCHPQVIENYINTAFAPENRPDISSIIDHVFQIAESQIIRTAIKRTAAMHQNVPIIGGMKRSEIEKLDNDFNEAVTFISSCIDDLKSWIDNDEFLNTFKDEVRYLKQVINNKEIEEVLKIFEGKLLLGPVLSGLKTYKKKYFREVHHHLNLNDFPDSIRQLKECILSTIN